jgi:hypothetical protein
LKEGARALGRSAALVARLLALLAWFAALLLVPMHRGIAAQERPGTTSLRVLSLTPLRIGPLSPAEYDAGYTDAASLEYAVSRCSAAADSPARHECTVAILGVLPLDGRKISDVQWAVSPTGPWTDLTPVPAIVARVRAGEDRSIARLYLRVRISYGGVPARPEEYLGIVRLRLVQ